MEACQGRDATGGLMLGTTARPGLAGGHPESTGIISFGSMPSHCCGVTVNAKPHSNVRRTCRD